MWIISVSIVLADPSSFYINEEWGFRIEQPKGWYITESSEFINLLKEQKQYQKIGLLKDSGLIVTFTKFPFNSKDGFNPNITVSCRKVLLAVQPTKEQFIIYAKKTLKALAPEGVDLPIKESETNGIIEMQASYEYGMANDKQTITVVALTALISNVQSDNYYVIVASCLKEDAEVLRNMLKESVESFQILEKK
jgi:hypothetical protein